MGEYPTTKLLARLGDICLTLWMAYIILGAATDIYQATTYRSAVSSLNNRQQEQVEVIRARREYGTIKLTNIRNAINQFKEAQECLSNARSRLEEGKLRDALDSVITGKGIIGNIDREIGDILEAGKLLREIRAAEAEIARSLQNG